MGSVIFARTGHGDDPCPTAEECSFRIPLLFFVYCTVDYTTYAMGLYVIQRGGANLMVLTSAIAVPLQQMAFALHFVLPGKLYQPVVYTDRAPRTAPALAPLLDRAASSYGGCGCATVVALVLCLSGFAVYQKFNVEAKT